MKGTNEINSKTQAHYLLQGVWILTHECLSLTYKVLPLGVKVSLVCEAAFHDVGTIVGARFDGSHGTAVGAINQFHQGPHALWTKRHLEEGLLGQLETETSGVKVTWQQCKQLKIYYLTVGGPIARIKVWTAKWPFFCSLQTYSPVRPS